MMTQYDTVGDGPLHMQSYRYEFNTNPLCHWKQLNYYSNQKSYRQLPIYMFHYKALGHHTYMHVISNN